MPITEYIEIVNEAGRRTTVPSAQLRALAKKGWRKVTDDDVATEPAATGDHAEVDGLGATDQDDDTSVSGSWTSTLSEED